MANTVQINPEILSWARVTAGLSVEEAAEKLGLKTTTKATAAEKLLQVESGARPVSHGFLQSAVSTYRRPLITFYLPRPPVRGERGEDFRTVMGAASPRDNATLDALIRDVRARQQMLREVIVDDESARKLSYVASCRIDGGIDKVEASIRTTLGITVDDQGRAKDPAALFSTLRAAAERAGIYVLLLGDLGSHHSDISEDVFRGFALADDFAPFVVINDNDAAAARSFTLVHELAHIWIGASGVSGPLRGASENIVERFCNSVAGEFLLPAAAVAGLSDVRGADVARALAVTSDVARVWKVSQGVVTYRLLLNGWISSDVAAAMFRTFSDRWRAERQRAQQSREPGESGPDYYVVRRSRLGIALLDVVRRALQADILTHTKAAKILGVKPTAVNRLLHERQHAA
jgi:Zn-dependent peptidase ImmA (M78 family)/transcriptional regulator with XRE-family HTH domain